MPSSAMDGTLFVNQDQCVRVEGVVGFTFAADVNHGRSILALKLFEELLCQLAWHCSILYIIVRGG